MEEDCEIGTRTSRPSEAYGGLHRSNQAGDDRPYRPLVRVRFPALLQLLRAVFRDFEEWLRQKQRENNSQYYRRTRKRRTDGSEIIYYDCHRSGRSRECKGPRQRARKAQGSPKINAGCTSHCIVTVGEKTNVVFWATHYGHEQEIKHLKL
ncbi:uncharacterized protein [Anabrus simplex]|uniref:uncharacterized protein n=1 Tax=Anabrus simplex TaxID=316456 RepID=UPI0035A2BAA7